MTTSRAPSIKFNQLNCSCTDQHKFPGINFFRFQPVGKEIATAFVQKLHFHFFVLFAPSSSIAPSCNYFYLPTRMQVWNEWKKPGNVWLNGNGPRLEQTKSITMGKFNCMFERIALKSHNPFTPADVIMVPSWIGCRRLRNCSVKH